mmetsp:Transcript_19953/g.49749  ORF Transcript_19953/g.49749 Transcript_19953/m.49749 type:complete len:136 (+) Transcript_19953:180-587(+)
MMDELHTLPQHCEHDCRSIERALWRHAAQVLADQGHAIFVVTITMLNGMTRMPCERLPSRRDDSSGITSGARILIEAARPCATETVVRSALVENGLSSAERASRRTHDLCCQRTSAAPPAAQGIYGTCLAPAHWA